VKPLATDVLKGVCGSARTRGLAKSERSRYRSLVGRLKNREDRVLVGRDRRAFLAQQAVCGTSSACQLDLFRAQIRLYDELDICAASRQAPRRCLERVKRPAFSQRSN
jgi:hypothetical protein